MANNNSFGYVYSKEYWEAEQADYEMEKAWQRAEAEAQRKRPIKPSPFDEPIVIVKASKV